MLTSITPPKYITLIFMDVRPNCKRDNYFIYIRAIEKCKFDGVHAFSGVKEKMGGGDADYSWGENLNEVTSHFEAWDRKIEKLTKWIRF